MSQESKFEEFVAAAAASKKLFKLDSVAPVRTWDYAAPTIVQEGRFTSRVSWTESANFAEKFFQLYPILKDIDLTNLAVSGGAVVDLLLEGSPKDIDMFVITEKKMEAREAAEFAKRRIERFLKDIFEHMTAKNATLSETEAKKRLTNPNFRIDRKEFFEIKNFAVKRFRNVFTATVPSLPVPIQLVSTPYASLNDLFDHVDLQCTAVSFYQREVQFSELGKFCFENLAIVLTNHQKDSYHISRLVKYFNKGFDIILPSLDVAKIRTHNFQFNLSEMLDLPYLLVEIQGVAGNKIDGRALNVSSKCLEEEKEEPKALYPGNKRAVSGGVAVHKNISNLIKDKWEDFLYEGQGPSYKNAFLDRPLITERMIVNTYKTVEGKIFSNGALKLSSLEQFFTVKKTSQIVDELIVEYVRTEEASGAKGAVFGPKYSEFLKKKIESLVKEQVQKTKERLMELQKSEVQLPADSVESLMTSASKEDWYGGYLKAQKPLS